MPEIVIPVYRGSDLNYYDAMLQISESKVGRDLALNNLRIRYPNTAGPQPDAQPIKNILKDTLLGTIVEKQSNTMIVMEMLLEGANVSVSVLRGITYRNWTQSDVPRPDEVKIIFTDAIAMTGQAIELFSEANSAFGQYSKPNLIAELGKEAESHFDAREQALTRLETLHSKLLHDMESTRAANYAKLDADRKQLEEDFELRRRELAKRESNRMSELDAMRAALEKERAEIDLRRNTVVRRELYERLVERLRQRQTNFELSIDSRLRRRWVFGGFTVFLTLLLATMIYYSSHKIILEGGGYDYVMLAKQAIAWISFTVTFVFFIRWMNNWAIVHAEEEFKHQQLEVDLIRASLVVEMAFEWDETMHAPLPQGLLETLSANLFTNGTSAKSTELTPSDAVAKALTRIPNTTAKIDFPGGTVTLGTKALKSANSAEEKEKPE